MLTSHVCRQEDFYSDWYSRWAYIHDRRFLRHRRNFEISGIAQALAERDCLGPGKRVLGFSVGQDPFTACFAALGCDVLATDLAPELAAPDGWVRHQHHCAALEQVYNPGLCDPAVLRERVQFQHLDVRKDLSHLTGFDAAFSCSSLEHLDDFAAGLDFVERAMACLKPGGVFVATTEYNVSSNDATVFHGRAVTGGGWPYVVYRRRDLEGLAARLTAAGHTVAPLDFDPGDGEWDRTAHPEGRHPYDGLVKHFYDGFVQTSFLLIVTRGQ